MKFEIFNRYSLKVQVTAEINCQADAAPSVKLGLAVRWAIANRANLSGADLSGADLSRADLSRANLSRANLSGADLSGADLSRADLSRANLSRADLSRANLSGADLYGADLYGAEVSQDTKPPTISILPDGDLIGWKKLKDGVIAKLSIPQKAKRVNSTGRKCRAEYVKVLALFKDAKPFKGTGIGARDGATKYRIGKITRPDSFNDDWCVEYTNGIHFFITRAEAEAY